MVHTANNAAAATAATNNNDDNTLYTFLYFWLILLQLKLPHNFDLEKWGRKRPPHAELQAHFAFIGVLCCHSQGCILCCIAKSKEAYFLCRIAREQAMTIIQCNKTHCITRSNVKDNMFLMLNWERSSTIMYLVSQEATRTAFFYVVPWENK